MKLSPPALGRPMDWAYASNRFIVIATPVVGSIAGLVALIRGETFLEAVGWGISAGGVSFLAWAITREIHPDRVWPATVATFVAPVGLVWGRPDLLATATVLLVARAVAGTTGRELRPADLLLLGAVGLPIVGRESGIAALAVGAIGLALAAMWHRRRRLVAVAASVLYGGAAAAALLIADGIDRYDGDGWALLWIGVAAGVVTLLGPGRIVAVEDRREGEPLRPARVRAARAVALVMAGAVSLTADPAAMASVWAAFVAVAARPR